VTVQPTRRDLLRTLPAAALVPTGGAAATSTPARDDEPFLYGLNTSTIRGQKLSLPEEIDLAAEVGYRGMEPWINEIDEYVKAGGSLKDLAKRLSDRGIRVESAIGFPEWIVDDDARRAKGLEEAKRAMDLVRQIGGTRLAAPPAGATDRADLDLRRVAERYRALLELGDRMDVVPQVELWGFSQSLSRLGEVMYVAIEANHPKACVLADVYHLYKGGNSVEGLKLLGPRSMFVMHMNDYPADPPRSEINDAQRVYPGDGIAPLAEILRILREVGFRGMLSLELFNREYWQHDARTVLKTGLEKMKAAVAASRVREL
jgi:sugar phosphate isomerase/epimerase